MRIHYLQHVTFEGAGTIAEWASARGHSIAASHVAASPLPPLDTLDFLVVMGGPMNIYQERKHPWLREEKAFISGAISAGKLVLGVCLGAQLVAHVLGGQVTRGAHPEIGWYSVELTQGGRESTVFGRLPARFTALHWHGDTFAVPPAAIHAASSQAYANQAFEYEAGRVIGVQFHLEETRSSLASLVENAADELIDGPWISSADDLLASDAPFAESKRLLFTLLDGMAELAVFPSTAPRPSGRPA
jgi:GMP synthase-like glutamine amidotransferase